MKIEEALGLVEEIKSCSLPWDDAHWEALDMVINYVKDKLNEDFKNTWKPSDEQMDALHYVTNFDYGGHKATLVSLYEQLKKLKG